MWVCLGWGRKTAVCWKRRATPGSEKRDWSPSFSRTCCLLPATTDRAKLGAMNVSLSKKTATFAV